MDEALFHRHLKVITTKDFPPRSHLIERVEIEGSTAVLRVVPKPGFSGEAATLRIPVSDDWDSVFLDLGRHRFFQQLFTRVS